MPADGPAGGEKMAPLAIDSQGFLIVPPVSGSGEWCLSEPESPKVRKSQHPLHQRGMKPTLCDGDNLEEQDLLLGGEPRGPTPGPPGTIEHHGVLRCKRDKR